MTSQKVKSDKVKEIIAMYGEDVKNWPPDLKLKVYQRLKNLGAYDTPGQRKPGEHLIEYQKTPVIFGQNVLGARYTSAVETLMESVVNNRITVALSANAIGKTYAAADLAIWWFLTYPQSQVHITAAPPERNLKQLLWGEIMKRVNKHPDLFSHCNITSLLIARKDDTRSFIEGVTIPASGTIHEREAKFSGKHAPHNLFLNDEADAIPDECFKGEESCMSGEHERQLNMFNPRQEKGAVYRMIRDGLANVVKLSAFDHPNVITGEDIIPGAVSRQTTVNRILAWTKPLLPDEIPDDSSCFEVPTFLISDQIEAGYRRIQEAAFSYMVLGQYPPQGVDALISQDWINAARSRWDTYVDIHGERPPIGTMAILGVDPADIGDDETVLYFRWGGFLERAKAWKGVDPDLTASKACVEAKLRGCRIINVDSTGVGAGIAPALNREGLDAYRVMVSSSPTREVEVGIFYSLGDQTGWSVREWLKNDPGAMLPPDEKLLEELKIITYRKDDRGKIRLMRKDDIKLALGRSPDRFDALKLTFANQDRGLSVFDLDKIFYHRNKEN